MERPSQGSVPVLVINGPVGIGKSSAAEAVSGILAAKYALSHALVDLDDIRSAFPRPQNDPFHMSLGFKNLAAMWPNYREAGSRCLIVPSVMGHASDLDQVREPRYRELYSLWFASPLLWRSTMIEFEGAKPAPNRWFGT